MIDNITPDVEEVVEEVIEEPVESDDTQIESDETEQEEQSEETSEEIIDRLMITYNGEEKELSFDEAKVLAQKGMNYDKVIGKLEEANNNPLLRWAKGFRDKNGFNDTDTFLTALNKEEEERKLNDLISKNIPKEYAEKLLEVDKIKEQLAQKDEKDKSTKEFSDFLDWHDSMVSKGVYPEALDAKSIPQSVWDSVNTGMSLREAYMENSLTNLRSTTEQATIDKLSKNANSSPGPVNKNSKAEDTPLTTDGIEKLLSQMTESKQREWIANPENYAKAEKAGIFK